MGRFLTRSLAHRATAVAAELVRTPGAMLVRVEWESSATRAPRRKPLAFSRETLPELLEAPDDAVGFRVTVSGAFEPTSPIETDAALQTELTRLRRIDGQGDLPAGTVVQRVGMDDLGFFSYQLTLAQTAADPITVPTEMLCEAR